MNEQLACAFGVQLGGPPLRNELAFADRQAQTDGVTLREISSALHGGGK